MIDRSLEERREDLEVRREEHDLERDQSDYRDARLMKWILFSLAVGGVGVSFAGTLLDWSGASHTFTALVSVIAGNLVRPYRVFRRAGTAAWTRS